MGTVGNTVTKQRPGAFERERDAATIRYLEEIGGNGCKWWAWMDSNQRPRSYQDRALTA